MSWITPKTDWDTDDGIMATDLNRIEGNTQFLNDGLLKKGISYYANNTTAGGGAYNIRVAGGNLFSQSAVAGPMPGTFDIQKVLSSTVWAAGDGTASPCRVAAAQAVGANQWWYVFILYNPTTAVFDVCMDDNAAGTNIQGSAITTAGFTMWKRVACQFEAGVPISGSARLWNTIGHKNHFFIHENIFDRSVAAVAISAGTTNTQILSSSTLIGTPKLVPPGLSYPVFLEFAADTAGSLEVWSALNGTSNVPGGGGKIYIAVASYDSRTAITVIPDGSDQICIFSTPANSYYIIVTGWIDNGED